MRTAQQLSAAVRDILTVRVMLFSLTAGSFGLMNAALFGTYRQTAFVVGTLLGGLLFVSLAKITRLAGTGLVLSALLWAWAMVDAGLLDLIFTHP